MQVQVVGTKAVVGGHLLRFVVSNCEDGPTEFYAVAVFFGDSQPAPLVASSLRGHYAESRHPEPVIAGNRIVGVRVLRVYSVIVDTAVLGILPTEQYELCLEVCRISVLDMINECS